MILKTIESQEKISRFNFAIKIFKICLPFGQSSITSEHIYKQMLIQRSLYDKKSKTLFNKLKSIKVGNEVCRLKIEG